MDIDWEHPAAGAERTTHYPAMLKRIKQEIGADRRVYATVDPTVMISNSVFSSPNAIDGVSLDDVRPRLVGQRSAATHTKASIRLPEYADGCTEAWTEPPGSPERSAIGCSARWGNNAPEEKLGRRLAVLLALGDESRCDAHVILNSSPAARRQTAITTRINGRSGLDPRPNVWLSSESSMPIDSGLQHIIIWELGQDVHPTFEHPDP